MIAVENNVFHSFLAKHDERAWNELLSSLIPAIHPVDQTAVRIWFSFWPLKLSRSLQQSSDATQTAKSRQLDGNYRLEEQVDSSVEFIFGSRYWSSVKKAILAHAEHDAAPKSAGLEAQIREVASRLAAQENTVESLLLGITAVGFMALQQVGMEAFSSTTKASVPQTKKGRAAAEQLLQDRSRKSDTGLLRFLCGGEKRFTVTFDEYKEGCRFTALKGQDLSMASSTDTREYQSWDQRRIAGPIPAQCRSGACGYCWVGVLNGKERLSESTEFEKKRLKYFGYASSGSDQEKYPHIRLSCQSKCYGDVSVVIPPWNGVLNGRGE